MILEWNGLFCECRYEVDTMALRNKLMQPIELLGKGFAKIHQDELVAGINCTYSLLIKETKGAFSLSREEYTIVLCADRRNLLETEMISCVLLHIYLLEGMLHGILAFHGSTVRYNGKSILFLGESGAGKTSIAFELCTKDGAEMVGNDFCGLIWEQNSLKIVWNDHDSKMSLRNNVLSDYSGNSHHIVDPHLGSENRQYFDPNLLDIRVLNHSGTIDYVFWIELSEMGSNKVHHLEYEDNILRLFLNSMGLVNGLQLKLFDYSGNWISNCLHLLNDHLLKQNYDYLEKMVRQYECKEIVGDLTFVLQVIQNECA